MNNWIRRIDLDDVVFDRYKIKPQIYRLQIDRNQYKIKLNHNGKEIILTEILDRGLTKSALLEFNGETKNFNTYEQAEKEAMRLLGE